MRKKAYYICLVLALIGIFATGCEQSKSDYPFDPNVPEMGQL